jgi:hypothetical protein
VAAPIPQLRDHAEDRLIRPGIGSARPGKASIGSACSTIVFSMPEDEKSRSPTTPSADSPRHGEPHGRQSLGRFLLDDVSRAETVGDQRFHQPLGFLVVADRDGEVHVSREARLRSSRDREAADQGRPTAMSRDREKQLTKCALETRHLRSDQAYDRPTASPDSAPGRDESQ